MRRARSQGRTQIDPFPAAPWLAMRVGVGASASPTWTRGVKIMDANKWVVVANVGESVQATRSDSSGDMEQLELMELVLM